jgi:hypothetical protein
VLGLASPELLGLVAGLVAVLLGGVLWGWPRLARPGWGPLLLRIAALVLLNTSVIALIFVVVNRANGFYTSWSDLFGRYHGGGTLRALYRPARAGTSAGASDLTAVLGAVPVRIAGRQRPAGTLQTVVFRGQLSGLTVTGHVYLPPGYPGPDASSAARYPVIVAITRFAGGDVSPYGARPLATAIAAEIAAGRLGPLIAVIVPPLPGSDASCLDVPGGSQGTVFFARDLPTAIGSRYRVSDPVGGMALLGDPSGGYCALHLALSDAAVYGAVAIPPGRYQTPPGSPGWGNSPQLHQQDNLLWVLHHQPPQPITVLFTGPGGSGAPRAVIRALNALPARAVVVPFGAPPSPLAPVLDRLGRLIDAAGG